MSTRPPNCDGSIYFPSQQLSDASSYANQRLADVDAMCDPNDPVTADACKVYEMFQSCYGAVDQEIRRLSGGGLLGTLERQPASPYRLRRVRFLRCSPALRRFE